MSAETHSAGGHLSEGQSSEGQSSGGRKKRDPRKQIPLKLHIIRTLDDKLGLGRFHLEMPSNLEISKINKSCYPLVVFDLKDDDQVQSFERMKKFSHANILEVCLIDEVKGQGCRIYVESYMGVLSDLLSNIRFVMSKNTSVVPSVAFRDIVSDIIDGLNYLRENDEYHGNFDWDTTVHSNDGSKRIVKLTNFERKGSKTTVEGQVADCVSVGYALAVISQKVQQNFDVSTCCLIDDLSDRLISVTSETLDEVMRDIKSDVFFWDERRKRTFFAVELPEAWGRVAFQVSFTSSASMPNMPWTNQKYEGYLDAMEVYRSNNNMLEYDKKDYLHFLRCISGMYTHEKELVVQPGTRPVDYAVQTAHHRLLRDLKIAVDQPN